MLADYRERIVFFGLLIAESVRVYAVIAVLSLLVGLEGSPVAWPIIAGLFGAAMFFGWLTEGLRGDRLTLALIQAGVGLPLVYLVAASQSFGAEGLNLAWPVRLTGFAMTADQVFGTVAALIASALLWRRGLAAVSSPEPEHVLKTTFYTGFFALALLLIGELVTDTDAGGRLLVLPFFAGSLVALAVAELDRPRGDRGASFWSRVVLGAVGGLVALGLGGAVLGVLFGGAPLRFVGNMLAEAFRLVVIVVAVPVSLIISGIFAVFAWLIGDVEPEGQESAGAPEGVQDLLPEEADDPVGRNLVEQIVDVLQYPLAVLLIVAVLVFLFLSFRRIVRRAESESEEERESVRADADPAGDMLGLLGRLIPNWMRRGGGEPEASYPRGEAGITEVFFLYFRYLRAAVGRGLSPGAASTPNELSGELARTLPDAPVALLTERFNAACYGREPSSPEDIARLREGLQAYDRSAARERGESQPD
ncbi:MAG: DUF4129 domain-containing protein [Chloroflexota bacterium]